MAVDVNELVRGRLSYAVREAALDDVRFERVRNGFAAHYLVHDLGANRFSFERGEGYLRAGRFDAFGLVDGGQVERVREAAPLSEGNVIAFAPIHGWLRYSLDIRTTLIVWAFVVFFVAFGFGADWLLSLAALVAIWVATIVLVQASLRKKVQAWLARESWN
jgi:hypothetical protein